LPGCANFSFKDFFAPQGLHARRIAPFALEGRFSLAWRDQNWIGALTWQASPNVETMVLSVAGQTVAQFERNEQMFHAKLADGREFDADSWSAISYRAIGVGLPFESAPYWVRGAVSPLQPSKPFNADAFEQLGWKIEVLARDVQGRPQRVRLSSDTAVMTLFVDTWQTY
jgi:outer membrane biogenesis lipoprotein LolB